MNVFVFYIFQVEEAKCQNSEFEGNLEVSKFNFRSLGLSSQSDWGWGGVTVASTVTALSKGNSFVLRVIAKFHLRS